MNNNKILVFIPTYNEAENVENIFQQVNALPFSKDILFLDDNSPDGTGKIIDALIEKNPNTIVIHRKGKLGIGSAHLTGINWAYEKKYETLITMDCDFTHSPSYITDFIQNSHDTDVVVGSRYMQKDSLVSWNLFRKTLTHLGHFLTKLFLNMPYDASGAFRLYRISQIQKEIFGKVASKSYSFFFESLFLLHFNNYSIKEIPIHLPTRTYGHSKMQWSDALFSVRFLFGLFRRKLFNKKALKCFPVIFSDKEIKEKQIEQDWDVYWSGKTTAGNLLYDFIAEIYRKLIIKNFLNHFILRNFNKEENILHAGCGSGQVDTDIAKHIHITALDISLKALGIYKSIHQNRCTIVHGSIFNLPFPNETFDGIYNLGVMEHFTEEEIQKILLEFKRVIKPGAKIVLFWPPVFGLTVNVLDFAHFVLNKILRLKIKLHPDEITRVTSKSQIQRILQKAGFNVVDYYFGIKDLFTQVVITAQKTA